MKRSDIVKIINPFLSLPSVVYNNYFLDETIDLYGIKPALSIVDCCAAIEAKTYKNTLNTFDKQLVKLGGIHVIDP
jgi:hypothetical protein